ncbi:MAG TPA: beta-1,6-N-acetylglucosaminyltransferase, partial [Puia sp.]|nr:beta-1,6-N-acetylglucosaminyltransferase [Puia sp.]
MELNYIILAHKSPRQLARLLEKLTTRESRFYIHIDKDVEIYPFRKEIGHFSNVVFLADEQRISAVWADFGMVQATINCMQQIIAD